MTGRLTVSLTTLLIMFAAVHLEAQQATDAATRTRLATALTAATDTPGGKGLLEIALAEARTALAQAVLAAQVPEDLAAMRQYGAAVLHAVDPSLQPTGPGLGYGVRRAVAALIAQIEAMAASDPKADVARAAPRALSAASEVQGWTDALAGQAQRLAAARDADQAAALSIEVRGLAAQVLAGQYGALPPSRTRTNVGGLHAVQGSLSVLMLGRDGALPAWLRQPREVRR